MPSKPASLSQSVNPNYSISGTFAWFVVVILSYVLLLAILAGPQYLGHHIKAGNLAEHDLLAPHRILVVDEKKTAELSELARQNVFPVLKKDEQKSSKILIQINSELERLKSLHKSSVLPLPLLSAEEQVLILELTDQDYDKLKIAIQNSNAQECPKVALKAFEKIIKIPAEAEKPKQQSKKAARQPARSGKSQKTEPAKAAIEPMSKAVFLEKLQRSRESYQELKRKKAIDLQGLLLLASVKPAESETFFSDLSQTSKRFLSTVSLQPYVTKSEWEEQFFEFLPDRIEKQQRKTCASFISKFLESNVSIDQPATELNIKEALESVKPQMKEVQVGSLIVKRGSTITAEQAKTLESLGITTVSDPGLAIVIAIALFAAFLLFGLYLYTYEAKLFFSPSAIALMSTVSIITCLAAFFIGNKYPQFVPLPATTLILVVTYGKRLTGILTALILLFLSVAELIATPHIVALGAAAIMALGPGVKHRKDLMITGILVGCMQMLGYTSAVLIGGSATDTATLTAELPLEMLGGLISAIAAIGSLPFLENIFGILTPYRIAELAEPDQPLMRQLEENAPGTYQHSLAVANLAEGGARAIGADVNLVHTGAMYHDIGKMVTPRFFIENQLGDKNPHDFIPPEESSAKVLAHVTNGLALAQKYGVPRAIQAFIPEHQGTTVMAYFYHKACLRDGAENVNQSDYRYPGPKPQTKESAIVMLADVSEAVTHSMHDPSMEEVETAIASVFKARWDDGQFSESGLSEKELEKVKRGFVRVWRTLHHERLKYPSTTTGKMPVVPTIVVQSKEQGEEASSQNSDNNKPNSQVSAAKGTSESHGAASEWDC